MNRPQTPSSEAMGLAPSDEAATLALHGLGVKRWALSILWPAFMMAAVLEMLVFALVDPAELRWFGEASLGLSDQSVYGFAFFSFWLIISLAGALTALLVTTPSGPQPESKRWPH